MDGATALAAVGLTDPGGDPQALSAEAHAWEDLSAYLRQHGERVEGLSEISPIYWQGPHTETFRSRVTALAAKATNTAQTLSGVAAQQRVHAETHERVLQIIREIGIQIAAMLAYWAAAAAFPPLVAAAESWLATLVVAGSRVLQLLTRSLSTVIRSLTQARNWVAEVMQLSWRTEQFQLGYGRLVTEGIRDFTIDISAGATSAGIQGNGVDPLQLIKNGLIGGGVGALLGGLERSGLSKVLDETGAVRRGVDDRPRFTTFSEEAKSAVKTLGAQPAAGHINLGKYGPKTKAEHLFDELAAARAQARNHQLHGAENELPEIRRRWGSANDEHLAALGRHYDALLARDEARARQFSKESLHDQQVDQLDALNDVADALVREAQINTAQARARLQTESERLNTWHGLDDARRAVQENTTVAEQWSNAWRHNAWRESFSSVKTWQDTLLYDSPRYFVKGFVANAAKTATDVALGKAEPDDIWKVALLAGATSSLRGGFNSAMGNRLWPQYGLEETIWKAGIKALDNLGVSEFRTVEHGGQ
jgi:acetolactate synthase regulatory subunit